MSSAAITVRRPSGSRGRIHRRAPWRALALGLALAAAPACGDSSDDGATEDAASSTTNATPQRVPADFRALLPDDTLLYVQASSVIGLRSLAQLMGLAPAGDDADVDRAVAALFSPAGGLTADDVALGRPLGFALAWPAERSEPLLMTLFHPDRRGSELERLAHRFVFAHEGTAARAIPTLVEGEAPPASGDSAVPASLPPGAAGLWVDVQGLLAHPVIAAQIDAAEGMAQGLMAMQPGGAGGMPGMGDFLTMQLAVMRAAAEDTRSLALGASESAGRLLLDGALHVEPGGLLADLPAPRGTDLDRVAGLLAPDASLRMLWRFDTEGLAARLADLTRELAAESDEQAELLELFFGSELLVTQAGSMQLGDLPLSDMRSFLQVDEPAVVRDAFLETMPRLAERLGGTIYAPPESLEVDGTRVDVLRVESLAPAYEQQLESISGLGPTAEQVRATKAAYFTHGDLLVGLQARDVPAAVRATRERLDEAPAGAGDLRPWVGRMEALGASFYLGFDVAPLFADVRARAAGTPPLPPKGRAVMSLLVGSDGDRWVLAADLDLAAAQRMFDG